MIAQYDSTGMINVTYNDPVPDGLPKAIEAAGQTFVDLPPLPGPKIQKRDGEGLPVFEKDGVTPIMIDGPPVQQSVSSELHYVKNGKIVERPSFEVPNNIALAVGESTSLTVPVGTVLIDADGTKHVIDDGILEFEGDVAGTHRYQLNNFPYRMQWIEVLVK